MNSKERVLTTFKFIEPDRVPLFEAWIETEIVDAIGGGDPYKTREVLGLDCMPITVRYPKSTNAWRTGTDQWGRVFENGMFLDGKVKKLEDLERYTPPLEYVKEFFPNEEIKKAKQEYGETHALYYADHNVCLGLSYMSMGLTDFFVAIRRNRELVDALMKRSTEWSVEVIKLANEAGVDFIMIGDDVAFTSGPMMSPELFRELVLPSYKKLLSVSKVPIIWHSDGAIEPLLPMIVEAGFAGIHSLEPSAHIDMSKIKNEYRNQLVLAGNLDVTNVLTQDNLAIVQKDVERCIRQGAPGGGYIFSSSNSLFKSMSIEAIFEAYRYAREFGRYS